MESSEWRAAFDGGALALRALKTRVPPLCHSHTLHPHERTGRSSMNRLASSNGGVTTESAPSTNASNGAERRHPSRKRQRLLASPVADASGSEQGAPSTNASNGAAHASQAVGNEGETASTGH